MAGRAIFIRSKMDASHVLLKLLTNELVLGKLVASSDYAIVLENPILVNAMPGEADGNKVSFKVFPSEYFQAVFIEDPTVLRKLPFRRDHVLHEFPASKQLIAMHTQLTSGLVLAPAGAEKNIKLIK